MRKAIWTTTTVLLALGLVASAAYARGGRGGPPGEEGFRRGPGRLLAQLDLAPEQEEAMKQLRRQQREEGRTLRGQMREAREALVALAERDDATIAEVEAAEDVMFETKRALHRMRRAHRAAMMGLLAPEQVEKVPNAWRLGLDRGKGRHGGRGWHRGPRRGGRGRGMGPGGCACPDGAPDGPPPDEDF